jgi:hypothetical protein
VSGWPDGGLGDDHTGGGSAVAGEEPSDGELDGRLGDAPIDVPGDVAVVPGRDRFVGSPVIGSIGDVVPNGCGVRNGDGVPVGDCDGSVFGDEDGGRVWGVVAPVWASAGAAASATRASAKIARSIGKTPSARRRCAARRTRIAA